MMIHLVIVVICFHSLTERYLQQLQWSPSLLRNCCDLLSFFDRTIFTTVLFYEVENQLMLWFAFILWQNDIYNSQSISRNQRVLVVICFHSLTERYLQQSHPTSSSFPLGCDLLSFFDRTIFTTVLNVPEQMLGKLWFAFILWQNDIYNSIGNCQSPDGFVVICFHSLTERYLQQWREATSDTWICCDLLSFFDRTIFTTVDFELTIGRALLWFAFILWQNDIYNSTRLLAVLSRLVVICFHSLTERYLQQ